jgi:SAM-dependent methyltransferase
MVPIMPTGPDEHMGMDESRGVEWLFGKKSAGWNLKYGMKGPLRPRLEAFAGRLGELAKPPARVLDFGCGTGNLALHLSGRGYEVSACDISSQMVERAREADHDMSVDWRLLPVGWSELPFGSNTFTAVVASSVFEYLADIDTTLAECRRVLMPGGYLLATVPNPRNLIRKLEGRLRPLSWLADRIPGLNRIPRILTYAAYLQCSRNRMHLDEWLALGNRMHFAPLRQGPGWAGRSGLVLLVFRKAEAAP